MKAPLTAACYIRVSTDDQTEYSPAAQKSAILKYCASNNLYLHPNHIYADEGKSGRNVSSRPAFQQMIAAAKHVPKLFDVILVHKFDRFARSREDSIVYKSLLAKECGIKVISITETIENDKMSIIMESMLEAMAEYYSINLSEEVKKGMTEKAKRGEPLTIAPFGYYMKNKELLVHPRESEIVQKIFADFNAGKPYLVIAAELNANGVRTKRNNPFENRAVEYILRNPVYAGYIRWNPTEKTKRNYEHPDIMINKGTHQPIIAEEVFLTAQKRIKELKSKYKKHTKTTLAPSHWLIGLVKCPACGSSYVNSNGYMVCNGKIKGKCPAERCSVRIGILEEMVLTALRADAQSETVSFEVVRQPKSENILPGNLQMELELRKERLERAYLAFEKGIDSLEEYANNKARLQAEIQELQSKIPKIKKTSAADCTTQFHSALKNILEALCNSKLTNREKHSIAETAIHSICVQKNPLTIQICYRFSCV